MPALMHNISAISRCAAAYRQEELAPLGLKAIHASYLITLCRNPGMTQEQLAKRVFVNKSNAARQVAVLEEAGFVTRSPSEEDKRAMLVYPTEKAYEALPKIRQTFRDWEALAAQDLTEEERQMLITMLSKMRDRAAQWMEEH
ncbi:MAG: MarR family transcriptional regulator [Oscillospiraceae bacterium]|nr:MarR family transcriptional regulator [Oscillospiraceae bacterium]MBQ9843760.1 MarR family transcriptional regulator [Oscillospiraceae bacterium]